MVPNSTTPVSASTPTVFIHGIEGAELVTPDGDRVWLRASTALGLTQPDLRLPMDVVAGVQKHDTLQPAGVLQHVSLVRGWIGEEVYGPFLDAMRRAGVAVHPFAYDWRRDNLETVAAFERFVAQHVEAHGGPVRLVAHSMGGLISWVVLNRHPEYFADVVFAGVPFAGAVGFLQDLHSGMPIGLNGRVLAPEVMFTFPSVYCFFPLDGAGLQDAHGADLAMDFFSADDWQRMQLSMFAPGYSGARVPSPAVSLQFLRWALPRAQEFRRLLVASLALYPPIRVVTSRSLPTCVRAVRAGPRSVCGWDLKSGGREPGDGRVAYADSLPYAGVAFREHLSAAKHSQLLNDPEVIKACLASTVAA